MEASNFGTGEVNGSDGHEYMVSMIKETLGVLPTDESMNPSLDVSIFLDKEGFKHL